MSSPQKGKSLHLFKICNYGFPNSIDVLNRYFFRQKNNNIKALGTFFDFHSNNILLLANKEAKAITCFTLLVKYTPCSGTPKIAIFSNFNTGRSIQVKTSFSVLNINTQ